METSSGPKNTTGIMIKMKNIALINAIEINSYMSKSLFDGENSLERTLSFARKLPDIDQIVVLLDKAFQGKDQIELYTGKAELVLKSRSEWDSLALFQTLIDRLNKVKGIDNFFYFYADTPLLDLKLTAKLYEKHCRYAAEYTFADGYPMGLAPEILSRSAISRIEKIALRERHSIRRDTVFSLIQKEINDFDLETEISPKDLRLLRVNLAVDNFLNFSQTKNLFDFGIKDAETSLMLPEKGGELLRSVPSYYQIQISGKCPQNCSYCPYAGNTNNEDYMSKEKLNLLLDKIESFSREATVSLSLWGEPSLHPEIYSILEDCLKRENLSFVVESSGIGWDSKKLLPILEKGKGRIMFILSLDTLDPALYQSLRGDGFEEVMALVEKLTEKGLISKEADSPVYIQAVRMKENEAVLESFYKYFQQLTNHIIIQKYDFFSGKLSEKKITDLSPLKRLPCWHLKREMNVLINGDVHLCREDLDRKSRWGNLFTDSPEEIWESGSEIYSAQLGGSYPGICGDCDEFYTFNF